MRKGLSPRLRGSPQIATLYTHTMKVYPRAYGGASSLPGTPGSSEGLSPRLRGSRRPRGRWCAGVRSIPAPTGEPVPDYLGGGVLRVYPRAYGGASSANCRVASDSGLSPRLRGSLRRMSRLPVTARSIPAPTGEPLTSIRLYRIIWVYPRAYGGANTYHKVKG